MNNRSAREKLEKLYGKKCFIDKLHLRKDDKPHKYKSKGQMQKMKKLTYHHIIKSCDGGLTTVSNGALLSVENHRWFHQQSEDLQSELNAKFQEYKKRIDECRIIFVDGIETPYVIDTMEICMDNNKKTYNRAKKKYEDRKVIKEYEDEIEI